MFNGTRDSISVLVFDKNDSFFATLCEQAALVQRASWNFEGERTCVGRGWWWGLIGNSERCRCTLQDSGAFYYVFRLKIIFPL